MGARTWRAAFDPRGTQFRLDRRGPSRATPNAGERCRGSAANSATLPVRRIQLLASLSMVMLSASQSPSEGHDEGGLEEGMVGVVHQRDKRCDTYHVPLHIGCDGWRPTRHGPSIVVLDKGAAGGLTTTTLKDDIYVFFFEQNGLMAGLGLQGTKITRITPDE